MEPPTSTPGGDRDTRPLTFLHEIQNSERLSFGTFFDIIGNFAEFCPEVNLSSDSRALKFVKNGKFLQPPSPSSVGDNDTRLLTYLYEILFWTTSI